MDLSFKTVKELQEQLGIGLRAIRLNKNLTQKELSEKAGVAIRSLTSLENGQGSSVETLVRALKALEATDVVERLAPQSTISPMALLNTPTPPRRARKPRGKRAA
jgi:transcriptional regulator with XRE-family HTH domain